MTGVDFDTLSGRDDALYRALGLLIRHLHVRGVIDAPDLVRDMLALADQLYGSHPQLSESRAGLASIADAITAEQAHWNSAREVDRLYRPGMDR